MTATIRLAVYRAESHDYLTNHDGEHFSFAPAPGLVHTYHEPMGGTDTGCIDLTVSETELAGWIVAPAGSKPYRSVCDEDCLEIPGERFTLRIDEAIDCAREGYFGLTWESAA